MKEQKLVSQKSLNNSNTISIKFFRKLFHNIITCFRQYYMIKYLLNIITKLGVIMYLKKFKIINFRKFAEEENEIEFTDSQGIKKSNNDTINIASSTTLLVGKNNSGKTTVFEALDKLVNGKSDSNSKPKFIFDDFNYEYIKKLVEQYGINKYDVLPSIEFVLTIGLDKGKDDLIVNLGHFIPIGYDPNEIQIFVKYEVVESEIFKEQVKTDINSGTYTEENKTECFYKLSKIINENLSNYKLKYYDENGNEIKKFKLSNLIDFFKIQANKVTADDCLSVAFNNIITARNKSDKSYNTTLTESHIKGINDDLEDKFNTEHTNEINKTLTSITDNDITVKLRADLTFEKIIKNLVKYEYIENNNFVPENQFGLGYTNLMVIISKLVEYMEKYPESSFNSKINLIGIEEPETYMHPQLQELFISHINEAIEILLQQHEKNVNSQIILSTHSSHIVNSKIHSGGTFNNINYISAKCANTRAVSLSDNKISPDGETEKDDFKFIKKHIIFKASDLFFADAAILVEGTVENILLPYFISNDSTLNKKFITILPINGAHALVYNNLIKLLQIPVAIITDLDIVRTGPESSSFVQITVLKDRTTTNETIRYYNNNSYSLDDNMTYFEDGNIKVFFQNKENGYIPTSLEESIILANYDNEVVNSALKSTKPQIYTKIVEEPVNYENNKNNSYKWQCKLSNDKTKFANELLYEMMITERNINLPNYIKECFEYIKSKLEK